MISVRARGSALIALAFAAVACRSNSTADIVLARPGDLAIRLTTRAPFDSLSVGSGWEGLNGLAVRGRSLAVADPEAPALFVFDSLDANPRRLGHGGDGPDELRRPRNVLWTSDSTVVVHDYQRMVLLEWDVRSNRVVRRQDLRRWPNELRLMGRLLNGPRGTVLVAPWEETSGRVMPADRIGGPLVYSAFAPLADTVVSWGRTTAPPTEGNFLRAGWQHGDAFVLGDTLHWLRSRDGVIELYDLRRPSARPTSIRRLAGFFHPRTPVDRSRLTSDGGVRSLDVIFDPLFATVTRLVDGRFVAVANTDDCQQSVTRMWPEQLLAVYASDGSFQWAGRLPGGVYRWLQSTGDTVFVLGYNRRIKKQSERTLQVFVLPQTGGSTVSRSKEIN